MAQKTKAQLINDLSDVRNQITSLIEDNDQGLVSPQDVRSCFEGILTLSLDMIDSLKHRDDP